MNLTVSQGRLLLSSATHLIFAILGGIIAPRFHLSAGIGALFLPVMIRMLFQILTNYFDKKFVDASGSRLPGCDANYPDGNILDFVFSDTYFADTLVSMTKKYPNTPLLKIWIGPFPQLIACTPSSLSELLGSGTFFVKGSLFEGLRKLTGGALFNLEGEEWRFHRKVLNPAFKTENIKIISNNVFQKNSQQLVNQWKKLLQKTTGDTVDLNIHYWTSRFTNDVVCEAAFGYEAQSLLDSPESDSFYKAVCYTVSSVMYLAIPGITYMLPGWKSSLGLILDTVSKIIQNQKNKKEDSSDKKMSLLNLMLGQMTDKEIQEETVGFLLAGQETTSTLMIWTMANLIENPEIQNKIVAEVDEVLKGAVPTWEDVARLPYLKAVVSETLRYTSPVGGINRTADSDTTIGGYSIPKGTTVWMVPHLIQRSEAVWESADSFNPDRFLNNNKDRMTTVLPAFGVGPRMCIGKFFALNEAIIALAILFQNFTFEKIGNASILPKKFAVTRLPQEEAACLRVRQRV